MGYSSLATRCNELGVSYQVVRSCMLRGMTFDEAVLHSRSLGVTKGNKFYKSKDVLYNSFGLSYSNARSRELNGWSTNKVLTPVFRETTGMPVEYDNRRFKSRSALCREYYISVRFVDRLSACYKLTFIKTFSIIEGYFKQYRKNVSDYALTRCPYCIIGDKWYWTTTELAHEFKINEGVLNSAIQKNSHDVKQALLYLSCKYESAPFISNPVINTYREFYSIMKTELSK